MRRQWTAFVLLCVGALMIVIDGAVVVVALPSIGESLKVSQNSLVGVVNAYTAANGGFLLCSGRMGDVFGYRRLFLVGTALFTLASVGCACSYTYVALIGWRVLQGTSGATVVIAAYSSVVILFPDTNSRARALGLIAFISSMGGIFALFLGGEVTEALGWRWVFLINLPIGVVIYILFSTLMTEKIITRGSASSVDLRSALVVTAAVTATVFAIQGMDQDGGISKGAAILCSGVGLLIPAFIWIQRHTAVPLIPAYLLRSRNFALCCVISVLSSLVGASSIFVSMYLQWVWSYTPLQVGIAFLPSSLIGALLLIGVSARIVSKYGTRPPLAAGLAMGSLGLLLLARAVVSGIAFHNILAGLVTVAVGVSIASTPNLVAAMSEVSAAESGVATGLLATATMVGCAVGLAVLGTVFVGFRGHLLSEGISFPVATNRAYQLVFILSAISNGLAIPFVLGLRRGGPRQMC